MKYFIIVLVAVAVIGGGYYWYTQRTPADTAANEKLNIDAICEGALVYMTFPDGASAEAFVAECKAGNRPEVIERYKADNGLNDGAAY